MRVRAVLVGCCVAGASLAGVSGGTAAAASCQYPAQVLDLANWKETLPIGSAGNPAEIRQPALATYVKSPWFVPTAGCDGVQFRAAVDGVTTSGSKNPRSELREMTGNGRENASWSSTSGTHTMTISEAVTNLPAGRPYVVAGQIHDADDDVAVFRLEGGDLYVTNGDDSHYQLVASGYVLGTTFEAKFVVSGGKIQAYYNGELKATIAKKFSGAYFKAGAYTQANCGTSSPCEDGNFGQVVIRRVTVTHR
ncbi:polysaccharide lyase family 7 protein [Amycolatopsis stemonae]